MRDGSTGGRDGGTKDALGSGAFWWHAVHAYDAGRWRLRDVAARTAARTGARMPESAGA
jgi:hypothetical protein